MHRIWDIPELLGTILAFLDDKSDVLRCAVVCRSLSVEAARLIWKRVSAFRYLLGCFPIDAICIDMSGPSACPSRKFLFLKLPTVAEWDHMRFRASMIKKLTFPSCDNYDELLEVIQRHGIELTFPELDSLHLHVSVPKKFKTFLPLFAKSRLEEMDISFEGYNERLINTTMETFLSQSHPLRRLAVGATSLPEPSRKHLIEIIRSTPSITSLRLNVGTPQFFDITEAASKLANLQDFSFEWGQSHDDRVDHPPGFGSLRSLAARSEYPMALGLVQAIKSPEIGEISLHITGLVFEQAIRLFESMATMTSLTSVSVMFHHSRSVTWRDVEPLLACPSISKFLICVASPGIEMDDETISSISKAWPNLTSLWIDGTYSTPKRFRRPSLRALAELLGRCPKLQTITLEWDARARQLRQPPSTEVPRLAVEKYGKLSLNLRRSRIGEKSEKALAEYFKSIWPGELEIASTWDEDDWHGVTWEAVANLLRESA